jgi:predicted phage tail protein
MELGQFAPLAYGVLLWGLGRLQVLNDKAKAEVKKDDSSADRDRIFNNLFEEFRVELASAKLRIDSLEETLEERAKQLEERNEKLKAAQEVINRLKSQTDKLEHLAKLEQTVAEQGIEIEKLKAAAIENTSLKARITSLETENISLVANNTLMKELIQGKLAKGEEAKQDA